MFWLEFQALKNILFLKADFSQILDFINPVSIGVNRHSNINLVRTTK